MYRVCFLWTCLQNGCHRLHYNIEPYSTPSMVQKALVNCSIFGFAAAFPLNSSLHCPWTGSVGASQERMNTAWWVWAWESTYQCEEPQLSHAPATTPSSVFRHLASHGKTCRKTCLRTCRLHTNLWWGDVIAQREDPGEASHIRNRYWQEHFILVLASNTKRSEHEQLTEKWLSAGAASHLLPQNRNTSSITANVHWHHPGMVRLLVVTLNF